LAHDEQVKVHGRANDLISRLKSDASFGDVDIDSLMEPSAFIGRAPEQVDEFIATHVEPVRRRYAHKLGAKAELEV